MANKTGMTEKKSKNFERNLNAKLMKNQINSNLIAGEQILYQTANNIAPFDRYRDAPGPHLRQNTTLKVGTLEIYRQWDAVYARIRYWKNKKTPSSTEWVRKGYERKRKQLLKLQTRNVVK